MTKIHACRRQIPDIQIRRLREQALGRERAAKAHDLHLRRLQSAAHVKNPLNKTETFDYLEPGTTSPYLHTTSSVYTHTSRAAIVTTSVYDQNWRKTSTVVASGTLNLTTGFAYDLVGNLTDVTDPRGKIAHSVYDNRNRKTQTTEASNTTIWLLPQCGITTRQ